ncbi:peptidylprolyl isomerase [Geomonas subterranea]|uniref:peptidylprolyl isomerase n=1 Tax=Geomonas subterranea TaxID=2847989 RepID=A0ABX8LAK4_9BACT|nr:MULTISPECIES: peptidylprolyl isomerase [Geomonas]QXE89002.1 peptidylprolyl isomerase [Geomonas subterranea]QXM08880.1 peptidylprolyl isomerase [Geomonas subterranea]
MSALKNLITAAVAVLALCALPGCSEKGSGGTPVAKVNGTVITKPELDRAVKTLLAQNRVTQTLPPEQMRKAADAALEQLTSAELLYQEGKKLEIKGLDQLVEEKFQKNRASFPSKEEFEKAVKAAGMTEAEVRESMRREIVVNYFVDRQFSTKATCSDAEAKKFYDDNKGKLFQKGERLRASHILVSVDQKGGADEKRKAREKAETLLKRVRNGEEFAAVAKAESTCPSRAKGGELGIFGKGQMTPPFEKAAFALKNGEISGVVETEFGYHIIKLQERIAPSTDRFEDVKFQIVQYLKMEQTRKAVAAFLSELRHKAKIEKV